MSKYSQCSVHTLAPACATAAQQILDELIAQDITDQENKIKKIYENSSNIILLLSDLRKIQTKRWGSLHRVSNLHKQSVKIYLYYQL